MGCAAGKVSVAASHDQQEPSATAASPPMSYVPQVIHTEFTDPASGTVLFVHKPESTPGANVSGDIVCILDEDPALFEHCVKAAQAAHEAVKDKEKRNWHPMLTIVAIKTLPQLVRNPEIGYIGFLQAILPPILCKFGKPYGAGRALVARAGMGAEMLRGVLAAETQDGHKLFRFYLIGECFAAGQEEATTAWLSANASTTALPDQTQVFLHCAGAGAGSSAEAAARALETMLITRSSRGVDTTMFVTRDGEQTYTDHARTGPPPVTLDLGAQDAGASGSAASASAMFAERSMVWVGERFEAQKLHSLGSLLPWHEFK